MKAAISSFREKMRVQQERVLLKSGSKLYKTRHPESVAAATEAVRRVIPEQQRRRRRESTIGKSRFRQGGVEGKRRSNN